MKLGLMAHPGVPDRVRVAEEVARHVEGKADLVVTDELSQVFPKLPAQPLDAMDVDLLITVGGDGAILLALQRCAAPVFGVNMGELGFLTEVDPPHLRGALDRLLAGDFRVEERGKVAVRVNGKRVPDAANEAAVKAAHPSKLLALRVACDGAVVDHLRADGVIVATPTGTTSYSLSAGGPIVDPRVQAMLLVPLAAFKLSARPHVFPSTSNLEVALPDAAKDAVVVIDGQFEHALAGGDKLTFTGSEHKARFVRLFGHNFYDTLRSRLVR